MIENLEENKRGINSKDNFITYLNSNDDMQTLSLQKLLEYQNETFRVKPDQHLLSADEAVSFVNERGFIYFWPIKGVRFPSLWGAVAGERPVPNEHDDPGHITWEWKDRLLSQRRWYYGKILRKRATIISLKYAPHFYALSENYGSPEEDYLTLYEQGLLTQEARLVYETLLREGPLNTVALHKAAHFTSRESDGRFNKAITDLQADFKIMPIGVARAGAWNYAFIYEITARYHPELLDLAQQIGENQARLELTKLYFLSLGAASQADLRRLFGWRPQLIHRAINSLIQSGVLIDGIEIEGQAGEYLALPELL